MKKDFEEKFIPQKKIDKRWTRRAIICITCMIIVGGICGYLVATFNKNLELDLIGEQTQTIKVNDEYHDEGCKLSKYGFKINKRIEYTDNIDTSSPGTYHMTCKYENKTRTRYIIVNLVDVISDDEKVDIYYDGENNGRLFGDSVGPEILESSQFTISLGKEIDKIKYCIASYGNTCVPDTEAYSQDTFYIHEKGKKAIYIEKYIKDNIVKEVRYANIK